MKKLIFILTIGTIFSVFSGCQKFNEFFDPHNPSGGDAKTSGKVALDWYKLELRILLERNTAMNNVYFGYLGIALYEAVRYENKHSVSLSTKLNQMPLMPAIENKSYDWVISANAAMASVLRNFNTGLTPANLASIDSLESLYNASSDQSSEKYIRSRTFGQSVAAAVFSWYQGDNFNPANTGYVPPVFPGAWVPTPPAFANGIMPYLATARLYVNANADLVIPPAPYTYSEDKNSNFYKMAKNVYKVSKELTTDQKNMALYYVDQGNGVGYTPGGHQISLIVQVLENKNTDLTLAAEALAKAGIAIRDATIVCFTDKYVVNQIRPVTYIRQFIDTGWNTLFPTPPHPEYPSAHSLVTTSAMFAAAGVLGNNINIWDHTYDFRGYPARFYPKFADVGDEAGMSRLYGGIHYVNSIGAGYDAGKIVGTNVGSLKLQD